MLGSCCRFQTAGINNNPKTHPHTEASCPAWAAATWPAIVPSAKPALPGSRCCTCQGLPSHLSGVMFLSSPGRGPSSSLTILRTSKP